MSSKSIVVPIELGHKAVVLNERTDQFTHSWEVFVQGPNGASIESFVQKVVFTLHVTFDNPKRVVKSPPFRIQEKGYGAFNLPIEIYFKSSDPQSKKTRFEYDLFLQSLDSNPIYRIRKEKITFTKPSDDFRKKLLQGGGIEVSHSEDGQMNGKSSISRPSSGAKTKPKIHHTTMPATSSSDSTQRKQKPDVKKEAIKPKVNAFTALFGEPITSSSETKVIKEKSLHPKEKEKPPKEKDQDKHSSKIDYKKDSDREKKNEKHNKKEKEKSHKKSSKDKDKNEKYKESGSKKGSEKEKTKYSKGESKDSKENRTDRDKSSKYDLGKRSISPASSVASDSSLKRKKYEESKKVSDSKRSEKHPQEAITKNRDREKNSNSKPPKEPDKLEKVKFKESKSSSHRKGTSPSTVPTSSLPPPPSVSSPRLSREKSKQVTKVDKSPNWTSRPSKKSELKSSTKVSSQKEKSRPKPVPNPPPQAHLTVPAVISQNRSRSSSISSTSSSSPRRSRSKSSSSSRSSSHSQTSSRSRSRSRSSSSKRSKSSSIERKSTSRSRSQTPRSRSRSLSSDRRRSKSKSSHRSRSSSTSSCGSCPRNPKPNIEKNAEKVPPLQILMMEAEADDNSSSYSEEKDSQTNSPVDDLQPAQRPPPKDTLMPGGKLTSGKGKAVSSKSKSKASISTPPIPPVAISPISNPVSSRTALSSSSDEEVKPRPSRDKRKKKKTSPEVVHSSKSSPMNEPLHLGAESKLNGISSPSKIKSEPPSTAKSKLKDADDIKEEDSLLPQGTSYPHKNLSPSEFTQELLILRHKIEASFSNRALVQEIVNIIGEYSSTDENNLNFDLCSLDLKTIRKLQHVVK